MTLKVGAVVSACSCSNQEFCNPKRQLSHRSKHLQYNAYPLKDFNSVITADRKEVESVVIQTCSNSVHIGWMGVGVKPLKFRH